MSFNRLLGLLVVLGSSTVAVADEDVQVRQRAVEAIRGAGGEVFFDESNPQRPVIGVALTGPRVTDETLRHVRPFLTLRSLRLNGTRVTDAGLREHVAHLEGLEEVQLNYTRVTGGALEAFGKSEKLRALELSYTDVTDDGLAPLVGKKQLHTLTLSHTTVGDKGLARLAKLPALSHLALDGTKITQAGVKQLEALPLEFLSYSGTPAAAGGSDGFRKKREAPPAKPD